jgi:hypothetical protein
VCVCVGERDCVYWSCVVRESVIYVLVMCCEFICAYVHVCARACRCFCERLSDMSVAGGTKSDWELLG